MLGTQVYVYVSFNDPWGYVKGKSPNRTRRLMVSVAKLNRVRVAVVSLLGASINCRMSMYYIYIYICIIISCSSSVFRNFIHQLTSFKFRPSVPSRYYFTHIYLYTLFPHLKKKKKTEKRKKKKKTSAQAANGSSRLVLGTFLVIRFLSLSFQNKDGIFQVDSH